MGLYNALRALANLFSWVRSVFYQWASAIRNVPIVGPAIRDWLYNVGDYFGDLSGAAYDAADGWYAMYNWIVDNVGSGGGLGVLTQWADDLVAFIRDPDGWIVDAIRNRLRALYDIWRDPISYVLEIFYRYTGLSYNFIHDPRGVVEGWIRLLVGGALDMARDPRAWLIDRLDDFIPDFRTLINYPARWVRDRIEDIAPDLDDFLRDPGDFITERMLRHFEGLAERYAPRLQTLATKIIEFIW